MSVNKPYLITSDGLARVEEELNYLLTDKRTEIAERIYSALQDGQDDEFVDNAEVESARRDQSFMEGRIHELQGIVRNHQLIEMDKIDTESVQVGNFVTVVEVGEDEEERYHLVGAAEANPTEGRISNESPLGRAMLGVKPGATIEVAAPNGSIQFRVIKID